MTRAAAAAIALAVVIAPTGAVLGAAPAELWLEGPFGAVAAGTLDAPAPPAGEAGLVTETLDAPIALEVRPADAGIAGWGIVIEGDHATTIVTAARTSRTLSGGIGFRGPGVAGTYVVSARAVTTAGEELIGAWTIVVPDRPFPDAAGFLDLVPPPLIAASGATSATAFRGDGCFVSLCASIGRLPPIAALPALRPDRSRPLLLRLEDGGRFRIAGAELRPIGEAGPRRPLAITRPEGTIVALDPPPPGDWLLELDLVFDRERGRIALFVRLLPDDADDQVAAASAGSGAAG